MKSIIKSSILSAILIGFGVAVSLYADAPIGTFLFAFGLIGVCYLGGELFTGKCGYYWKNPNQRKDLFIILIVNLLAGWGFGALLGLVDPSLITEATAKINSWQEMSIWAYFFKSILCGMIMYIAVEMKKSGFTNLGIIYGIPLFIFCGFQHCIANIIVLGIAATFTPLIFVCILGNLIGSIIINLLSSNNK